MNFNMIENKLNETLLKLYKLIADVIKNILVIFNALNNIAIHVKLAFNHYSLHISMYYNCKVYACKYVELSFNYQDIILQNINFLLYL